METLEDAKTLSWGPSVVEPESAHASSRPSHLPYGQSLHYFNCGCPPQPNYGSRPCDVVDFLVQRSLSTFQQVRHMDPCDLSPLCIVYLLLHLRVSCTIN
jgi:hypothetical protein